MSLLTSVAIQSDFNIQGAGATLSYYRDAENEVLQVDSIVPITIETTTPEGNTVNATYNISVQASYAFPTLTITGQWQVFTFCKHYKTFQGNVILFSFANFLIVFLKCNIVLRSDRRKGIRSGDRHVDICKSS